MRKPKADRDAVLIEVAERLQVAQEDAAERAYLTDYCRGRSDAFAWAVKEVGRMRDE